MSKITPYLNLQEVANALRGAKGQLRTGKPLTNGLHQYIWRIVRFDTGADPALPVYALRGLQQWADDTFGKDILNFIYPSRPRSREEENEIDTFVTLLLNELKIKPNSATRWKSLI